MFDNRSQSRDGHRGGGKEQPAEDDPPMSRLFIICNKAHEEGDLREAFEKFGEIEDVWIVKDRNTRENKGIAYVKFTKTSDAAKAQEEMNGKSIGKSDRTLKVLVAANRNQGSSKSENEQEKYVRLFIVISKQSTEEDIKEEFSQWGDVESVTIVKEKGTGNPKGFGYVRYSKFYDAAVAFENCSPKYKAVFAEPKGSTRNKSEQYGRSYEDNSFSRNRGIGGDNNYNGGGGNGNFGSSGFSGGGFGGYNDWANPSLNNDMAQFLRMQSNAAPQPTSLDVIASNCLNQDQLWRLFDIIPGLDYCQISREYGTRTNEAVVVYNNLEAAVYAKEKLHGLEYPLGERLIVKVAGMNSRMDASFIDRRTKKDSICNVPLPPTQPMASSDSQVAQRLFIVLASNLPTSILKNVFSCWPGLMDIYLLPNKNCGYVKYADRQSARNAMETLNGAEICGTKVKVMEAEERGSGDGNNSGRKRLRRN